MLLKNKERIKIRISLEPAFQMIYWSLTWLSVFSCAILILEIQRLNVPSVALGLVFLTMFYFGTGMYLEISDDSIRIVYFRGLKKEKISIHHVIEISMFLGRKITLDSEDKEQLTVLYLNQKNKLKLKKAAENWPHIHVEEQELNESA